jgi:hypothetical protein
MNEQERHEYCLLWAEARNLAMERGLEMSLTCPMEEHCDGKKCVFIDPTKKVKEFIYEAPKEPIIGC